MSPFRGINYRLGWFESSLKQIQPDSRSIVYVQDPTRLELSQVESNLEFVIILNNIQNYKKNGE